MAAASSQLAYGRLSPAPSARRLASFRINHPTRLMGEPRRRPCGPARLPPTLAPVPEPARGRGTSGRLNISDGLEPVRAWRVIDARLEL